MTDLIAFGRSPTGKMPPLFLLKALAHLAACVRFFSRLAVPRLGRFDDPTSAPSLPAAAAFIPLSGLVIALPALVLAPASLTLGLSPTVVGWLILAALIVPTGSLHEDGVADSFDGLFGGFDRERRLAIMKDSRIGSFGALALILTSALRAACYATACGSLPLVLAAIIAASALSRALMVAVWYWLPPARPGGLASSLGAPDLRSTLGALATSLAGCLPLTLATGLSPLALGLALAAGPTALFSAIAGRRIGGHTGDILGAAQVIAECGFLIGVTANI